ncbi:MAG TPA: PAS domain S-box protein, partial [Bacteroidales bacterium]|nr:PAS domain S-box protein [Bacteroidales bacterium]
NYDVKYETISKQTVHVSDIYYNTDSLIVVDFVVPLFSEADERLGFLVFQHAVSQTIKKTLAQKTLTDVSRSTFTNIFFQANSSLVHYNYATHKIERYSHDSFFMSYSVLDSIKKNNLYTGQVSQKNSLFKKQDLFVVHNIKHTNLYIYTILPADEFYAQQIESQIYIIVLFIVVVLLFVFVFLLQKSNKKQSMYKKMYMLQEQYKTMLYSIGDAVIVTNELGIVQNVNGIAEELIGCTEAKAKHKYIDDLFTITQEQNNSTHSEIIQHVITTGKKHTLYHAQLRTHQQQSIPINESIAPIRDNNSVITGLVFVIHNQTKERQILQELEESNRKLESLFSNLPGMFYHDTYDENWHMEFVSSGVTELTGYTPFDFISKSVTYNSITHKDDAEYVNKVIKTAIKNKESFLLEYRIVCKNETIKWVWERGNGVFDKHGNIIAIEGYIEDISERKQTELALLESEEIYRKQFEDHTAIQFLVEPMSGDIINVNKAAVDYYGWDKAQ